MGMRPLKSAVWYRRRFVAAGALLASASWSSRPHARQNRVPIVGWLSAGSIKDPSLDAFRDGLRGLGYVDGRSIRIEARGADDDEEALRTAARDLARLPVDVFVSHGRGATRAAQEATATTPIVMAPVDDPHEFVVSLSRPNGNITGLALQQTEIDAKQIEILKEIVPHLTRLAIFYYYGETYYALAAVAHALNIEVLWIEIRGADEVQKAFTAASNKNADGLLIVDTSALGTTCEIIARTALTRRLPAAASWRGGPETSPLIAYAADVGHLQQRAASYVHRLLLGAKPQDLPVEQGSKFELTVNLRAAEALGVTVPPAVLLRAEVILD
jgi:putative ABC transport system substrate-binding protein